MSEFDPGKPATVYDELNDRAFAWQPEWSASYREHAVLHDAERGIMEWEGLLLAGWWSVEDGAPPLSAAG